MAPTAFINGFLVCFGFQVASSLLYSEICKHTECDAPSQKRGGNHRYSCFRRRINDRFKCRPGSFVFAGETLEEVFLPDLTPTCLGCICEATSNCNLTIGCIGRLCGPFLISKRYWIDAGKPVLYRDHPEREGAFETCVNDPFCAAQTLRQYMSRYVQDCNRNGYLECDDYARIHYLGGQQCYLPIHRYGYYRAFKNCQAAVQFLN